MNAIELLVSQHREVEMLFSRIESATSAYAKEGLFVQIADKLAVHAAIEEHHFYPAVKAWQTEAILEASVQEHLEIKRGLAGLLETDPDDDSFDEQIRLLKENVADHVAEEETELFPTVRKAISAADLEALGREMAAEQAELEAEGAPRNAIPSETDQPASI